MGVPGHPDIAFVGLRIAIFVDGGFWHGHPEHFTPKKARTAWDSNIRRNMVRDREVNSALFDLGWLALRYWDFEVLRAADEVAHRIETVVLGRRRAAGAHVFR